MYSEIIISKSLNNIVFEGRNKNYGAYQLRSDYEKHIRQAGLIVLFSISVLLGFSFIKFFSKPENRKPLIDAGAELTDIVLPPKIILPKTSASHPSSHHDVSSHPESAGTTLPTKIETDRNVTEMKEAKINTTTVSDPKGIPNITTSNPVRQEIGEGGFKNNTTVDSKTPPEFVEQMPEFPGGEAALLQYLQEQIHYTDLAKNLTIEGKVVLNFVVDEEGKISECTIKHALGGGLDEVAINAVEKMPQWKPGKQHGKNVAVLFTLPIDFELP